MLNLSLSFPNFQNMALVVRYQVSTQSDIKLKSHGEIIRIY
jgi:hypothetical protein